LRYVFVGHFLDLFLGILDVVFRSTLDLLETFVGFLADTSYADTSVLAFLSNLTNQLLSAFFSKHWNIDDHLLTIILRIESEVCVHDSAFNFRDHVLLPGLNKDCTRVGCCERRNLLKRCHCSVVAYLDAIEHGWISLACTEFWKFMRTVIDRLRH